MAGWRFLAAAAVLAGYALMAHWLMAHAPQSPWAVAALFGPLLAGIVYTGLRRRHLPTLLLCGLATLGLTIVVARGGLADVTRLYVLQHGAIHALLAWTFGMTLRPGAKPLITMMAEQVHAKVSPGLRDYTRRLTALWAAYFVAMIVISLVIYAFAPWDWWSLFCNVLTPLAATLLFVVEHATRYVRHPEFERTSLAQAVRAYRASRATDAR